MTPFKDPKNNKKPYPMMIQRRSDDAPFGSDSMCTYDSLRAAWAVLTPSIPLSEYSTTLFLRVPARAGDAPSAWRPLVSNDVGAWVRRAAEAAGLDPALFGTRALRMGGATDLYDLYGAEGARYIKERGRWGTDIAQIYQAPSAAMHGSLSRTIGDSAGPDLQSLLSGWRQPATTFSSNN